MTEIERFVEGVRLLSALNPNIGLAAEHDIIYVGPDEVKVPEELKPKLKKLGFHWDRAAKSWMWFT